MAEMQAMTPDSLNRKNLRKWTDFRLHGQALILPKRRKIKIENPDTIRIMKKIFFMKSTKEVISWQDFLLKMDHFHSQRLFGFKNFYRTKNSFDQNISISGMEKPSLSIQKILI
jgi:hypothetical protein